MAPLGFEAQLRAVESETAAKVRGWAKVSTHSLLFYPDFTSARANFNKDKVQRLARIFNDEGCHRHNMSHSIVGNIEEKDLQAALALSEVSIDDLQRREDPPRIFLPTGSFIRCTHGSSRVNALDESQSFDRWWTLALFTDLSSHAFEILGGFDLNSGQYSDGHIFSEICRLQSLDPAREKQWWSRLSKSKRDILKRLTKHRQLWPAYSQVLLKIPGMRDRLQIGSLPEIISSRSYEPITSYTTLILSTWTRIVGSESLLKFIDSAAVEQLQLRAPGVSQLDDEHITAAIRSGGVFRGVTDEATRERIVRQMRMIDYIIPSIHTLQQDFKYHRQCNGVIKDLLKAEDMAMWTVEKSARNLFMESRLHNSDQSFGRHYKLLILYTMRNLVELSQQNPLLEDFEVKQEPRTYDPRAWYELAREARRLGFNSKIVSKILSEDPDEQTARKFLLTARSPELFEYDPITFDSLVMQVSHVLSQAQRRQVNHQEPLFTVPHSGEPIHRRCGRQFSDSYSNDRNFLTESFFTQKIDKNTDVSSLFVRRSVFCAFWGNFVEGSESTTQIVMNTDDPEGNYSQTQALERVESYNVNGRTEDQMIDHSPQRPECQPSTPGFDFTMADAGTVHQLIPVKDQWNVTIYCMANNGWQKKEDCNIHSVQERVQRIKTDLEKSGQSFYLFDAHGRGINLDDCVRQRVVGIGPEGSRPIIEEEEL